MAKSITGVEYGEHVTGKDLILTEARNFGALIHMREEPLSAPIRFKEATDNSQAKFWLARAEERLDFYSKMTVEEAEVYVMDTWQQSMDSWQERRDTAKKLREEYERLLQEVDAWEPPTTAHLKLKLEATRRINEHLHQNCTKAELEPPPELEDAKVFLKEITASYKREVERYKDKLEKGPNYVEEGNKWIKDLLDSLPE